MDSHLINHWNSRAEIDDELAATLDPTGARRKNARIHALHRRAVLRAGWREGERVLDFGCGTGRMLAALTAHGCHATGIDMSLGMVDRAAKNGHAVLSDGDSIPFPDEHFDTVLSVYVVGGHHETGIAAVLNEIARVLAPNGRLILLERVEPGCATLSLEHWRSGLSERFTVRGIQIVRTARFSLLWLPLPIAARIHSKKIREPYSDVLFLCELPSGSR